MSNENFSAKNQALVAYYHYLKLGALWGVLFLIITGILFSITRGFGYFEIYCCRLEYSYPKKFAELLISQLMALNLLDFLSKNVLGFIFIGMVARLLIFFLSTWWKRLLN